MMAKHFFFQRNIEKFMAIFCLVFTLVEAKVGKVFFFETDVNNNQCTKQLEFECLLQRL